MVNEAQKNSYSNEVEKKIETKNEEPKPTVSLKGFSSVQFSQSISIHKTTTQKKEEEDILIQDSSNRPMESFTEAQFREKWLNYKNQLLENGLSSLASAFENLPEIEGDVILMTVENKALEDDVTDNKTEILDFLRKELRNYNLSLTTKINADLRQKKAYTPMEKFAKMSEKNPHLITLVKTFDMDINYPNK